MEKVMNEKIIMNYEVVELLHKSSSWGSIVFKVKPQKKSCMCLSVFRRLKMVCKN